MCDGPSFGIGTADAARGAATNRGGWRQERARCRELLGDDAESMTDQDIEDVRRHAETMAGIVVEMFEAQRRISE